MTVSRRVSGSVVLDMGCTQHPLTKFCACAEKRKTPSSVEDYFIEAIIERRVNERLVHTVTTIICLGSTRFPHQQNIVVENQIGSH